MVSKKQERATEILARLERMYPKAKCTLDYTNPFELLMATMLSAQSTDARVNIVTKSLFRKYPNPQSFAEARQPEMERDVRQTGFFRNKAKAVIAASKAVGLKVPLVVRMKGTNEDLGRKILADSGLPIISANNMAEAAEKVVAAAKR